MRIYLLTLEVAWSQSAISLIYLARYGIALDPCSGFTVRSGHAQLVLQHVLRYSLPT